MEVLRIYLQSPELYSRQKRVHQNHKLPEAFELVCLLYTSMPVIDGSELDKNIKEMGHKHHDHFHMTHPDAEWETCLAHAEKIGPVSYTHLQI